jgi:predicted  nucleic acid-binding Zn-ribbon protein
MSEDITEPLPGETLRLILARLDSIDSRLNGIDVRLDGLDTRLTALEEKVDRRLQETRPIWEQVLTRIEALETGFSQFRIEAAAGFRRLEHQIDILNRNILNVQTDQRELTERVTKLETEPTQ